MGRDATCSVPGCVSEGRVVRGMCLSHYARWNRTGDVQADVPLRQIGRDPRERYLECVDRRGDDECWPWTGRTTGGYGKFMASCSGGRSVDVLAHRFGYELASGPIPDGLLVCHRCDNPPCQNPRHLFLGTISDNNADMAAKGRAPRGERRWNARLTVAAVRDIRARSSTVAQVDLAAEYGVSRAAIYRVVSRQTWRHV